MNVRPRYPLGILGRVRFRWLPAGRRLGARAWLALHLAIVRQLTRDAELQAQALPLASADLDVAIGRNAERLEALARREIALRTRLTATHLPTLKARP